MLIALFGPSSAFTQWAIHVSRVVFDVSLRGQVDFCSRSTLTELRTDWEQRRSPHFMYFSDCPDIGIVKLFLAADGPMVVFLEDPADIVGFVARERNMNVCSALRTTSLCLSSIEPICSGQKTLIIRRSHHLTVMGLVDQLCALYGLVLSRDERLQIAQRLELETEPLQDELFETHMLKRLLMARPIGLSLEEHTDEERKLIEDTVGVFRALGDGRPVSQMEWAPVLFMPGDVPDTPLAGRIDLTGASRCVIYGPYCHLPPGHWTASVEFSVAENESGNVVRVDVYTDHIAAICDFVLPEKGRFAFELPFTIEDGRVPTQIRFITLQGAIEGWIDLESCRLARTSVPRNERNVHQERIAAAG